MLRDVILSTVAGRERLVRMTRASGGMHMEGMLNAVNVAFCKHLALCHLLEAMRVVWLRWGKGGKGDHWAEDWDPGFGFWLCYESVL